MHTKQACWKRWTTSDGFAGCKVKRWLRKDDFVNAVSDFLGAYRCQIVLVVDQD